VNLHDGRFRAATLRSPSGVLEMHLRCGDLQVGYFDLDLTYRSVNLSEAEVAELAAAVNLPETEVLYDEVDLGPEGSFVHRLLLWPRGELVIPFADLALRRRPTRSRRFRAPTPRFNAVPTRA